MIHLNDWDARSSHSLAQHYEVEMVLTMSGAFWLLQLSPHKGTETSQQVQADHRRQLKEVGVVAEQASVHAKMTIARRLQIIVTVHIFDSSYHHFSVDAGLLSRNTDFLQLPPTICCCIAASSWYHRILVNTTVASKIDTVSR